MKQKNNLHSRIEPFSSSLVGQEGLLPVAQANQGAASNHYGSGYGGGRGEAASDGVDLLKVAQILLRRWITVLLVMLLSGLIGILYTQMATPIYQAQSEVEMSIRRPKVITKCDAINPFRKQLLRSAKVPVTDFVDELFGI